MAFLQMFIVNKILTRDTFKAFTDVFDELKIENAL